MGVGLWGITVFRGTEQYNQSVGEDLSHELSLSNLYISVGLSDPPKENYGTLHELTGMTF